MDCHRPLAFAMTKGARGGIHKLVIARVACNSWQVWDIISNSWNSFSFLLMNKKIVVCRLLRRFTPRNDKGASDG